MRPDAHTLVAAYAVDALDDGERADVETHLEQCEVCRDDLRGFRETAAVLAAAEAEAPPARMREQVLARARATAQLPPLTSEAATTVPADRDGTVRDPAPGDDPATGPTVAEQRRRRGADRSRAATRAGSGRTLFALAASALTVVALAAGAWGFTSSRQLADVRAQQAAVQQVLSADDVVSVSGRPQLGAGVQGDEVVVLASAAADAALLLPAGLPAAPEGSTWQAWAMTGSDAVPAGVFDVRGGEAVALSSGIAGVDAVAVSLEPAGGSTAPTSDPVLVVPLA